MNMEKTKPLIQHNVDEGKHLVSLMEDAADKLDTLHRAGFERLVNYFGGNMSLMGRYFGYTRSAVCNMRIRGKITTALALRVDADENLPFTLKELRADHEMIRARKARIAREKLKKKENS